MLLSYCTSLLEGIILEITITLCIFCVIAHVVYNVRFHPLRKYPGPWWLAATRLPYTFYVLRGTAARKTKELHDKYGHVVRINPDTLSFTSSRAWHAQDIYGPAKPGGQGNIPKDPRYYTESHMKVFNDPIRRQLIQSHLIPIHHEACLQKHTSLFISKLIQSQTRSETGEVDLSHWLHLLTTDIAGEVIFGQRFNGLENGQCQPFIAAIPGLARLFTSVIELRQYPAVFRMIKICWDWITRASRSSKPPTSMVEQPENQMNEDKLACQVGNICEDERLSSTEKEATNMALIIAGSETTANLLMGSIYLLLKHPAYLNKLTSMLRIQFQTSSDMSLSALRDQQYLNAVLKESLRLYPPAPGSLFRRTDKEGHVVLGEIIPPKTTLTMNLWAANCSPLNFHLSDEMFPERWIQPRPVEYEEDDRSAMKAFSFGPQDCPGRNASGARVYTVEFGPGLGFRKPRLVDLAEGVYVLEKVAFESEMQISTGIRLIGSASKF
ncbi:isotrichodermin C-15 hydroxylase [Fusarium acutatum]|uniref:Isotrichodermin C-15 hydroxylase n=1 Tax=Fusarium acutatum TaxID=78861 RepID=A0A8H4JP32_9HYPO|nr:isotrichodermin C-15 hydroxylase [Fusarium acutatum]